MSLGDVHVPGHIHTPLYEHGFLDSQEIFAKPPMDMSFLSSYLFFVCLLFSQAVIVALGSYNVKQLPLVIFNKHPSSVPQSCRTLCDPKDCSMPDIPIDHQLLEPTQTHVPRIGDTI